jgi:hypothetical protein
MIGSFTIGKSSLSSRGIGTSAITSAAFSDTKKEFDEVEVDPASSSNEVNRPKLVIALPEAIPFESLPVPSSSSLSGTTTSGGGIGKSGDLYRKLFSSTQRRVGGGERGAIDTINNGEISNNVSRVEPRPVLLRRRVLPLIEAAVESSQSSASSDMPLYSSVPIEDFGAAMLRGMGVTEEEIQAAEMGDGDDKTSSQQGAAATFSIPMPTLNHNKKREREHVGLGAAANPLLASSNTTSSSFKRAKATSRSLHSTLNGLSERMAARMISVGGELASRIVMVWQLDGVPGLQKMLIKTISTTLPSIQSLDDNKIMTKLTHENAAEKSSNSSPSSSSSSTSTTPSILQTVVVGLREAVPVEESALSDIEATHWKELVRLVAQEEEAAMNEASRKAQEDAKELQSKALLLTAKNSNSTIETQHQQRQQEHNPSSIVDSNISPPPSSSSLLQASSSSSMNITKNISVSTSTSLSDNWLVRGISVRIADDRWRNGLFFRKKGVVMDVLTPGVCQLMLVNNGEGSAKRDGEGGMLLDNVPQGVLETALPKVGGQAIVIRGKKKGAVGILIERNKETETVVIRLDASGGQALLSGVKFDDVAECSAEHFLQHQ